jgi:hypothetical protein
MCLLASDGMALDPLLALSYPDQYIFPVSYCGITSGKAKDVTGK